MDGANKHIEKKYEYDVTVNIKKDQYVLNIKELRISTTDSDLKVAYDRLIAKKEATIKSILDNDLLDAPPSRITGATVVANGGVGGYVPFLVKTLIIGMVLSGVLLIVGTFVGNKMLKASSQFSRQIGSVSKLNLGRQLEKEIIKAAGKSTSPKRQEQLIKSVRILVNKYKPLVREVQHLFGEPEERRP